jgi:hypothetical protein
MGFDLLLMLIINLTVFLVISGFSNERYIAHTSIGWLMMVVENRPEKERRKEIGEECEYRCFKKKLFSCVGMILIKQVFNADDYNIHFIIHTNIFFSLFHFYIFSFFSISVYSFC